MTKPNKTEITEKLTEWARLERKRLRIEAQRDEDLDPHVAAFAKATESINSTAKLKLDAVAQEIATVAKDIETALLAGVDQKTGVIALAQVALAGGKALAEVKKKDGDRVVDPQKYFKHTPPAKRTADFWLPVKIGIAPAIKFFGEKVLNAMATKATTYKVELKLG